MAPSETKGNGFVYIASHRVVNSNINVHHARSPALGAAVEAEERSTVPVAAGARAGHQAAGRDAVR